MRSAKPWEPDDFKSSDFKLADATSNVRRSQMSPVFHSVRTIAPGVPLVPKPPWPVDHAASSKSDLSHSSAGLAVVYFHICGSVCDVGTSVRSLGGGS